MKIGAFKVREPLPDLGEPDAIMALSPWINGGSVGSSTVALMEEHFKAKEVGRLSRPELFYDFTRYRPQIHFSDDHRDIAIPNTTINYTASKTGNGLMFMHCLEPHMMGETYAESIIKVMEKLHVKRYWLLGGMYDSVPHTRELITTGFISEKATEIVLSQFNVEPGEYQGPSTISSLILVNAPKRGIETVALIVHLPYYAQLDEDYSGQFRLLSLLSSTLNLSIPLGEIKRKGEAQYRRVDLAVEADQRVKDMLGVLEMSYDSKSRRGPIPEATPSLSPEIEKFLKEINKDFD